VRFRVQQQVLNPAAKNLDHVLSEILNGQRKGKVRNNTVYYPGLHDKSLFEQMMNLKKQ
jgi:hypothetical protein